MGYGYEARFVNRQMVTVKDLEDEQRNRMTIRALNLIWYRAGIFTVTCGL